MTDSSVIKDVLVIGNPIFATKRLSRLFDCQIATLNQIRIADEEEEERTGTVSIFMTS